jgi:hypothetical protein
MMINEEEYQQRLKDNFFRTTCKSAVDGFSHFYENVLPFIDDRYEKVQPALDENIRSAEQLRKILTELHDLDDRFLGEVLDWGKECMEGATYTLVYLSQDIEDVACIINSFGALAVDPFIQFSLGNEFSKKLKSTYLDTVSCYFSEWGAIPELEVEPAHWQVYLNDFSHNDRNEFLAQMGLSPLRNPSFPPRHVMKWFSGESFDKHNYISDLLELYVEAGIDEDELTSPEKFG